jgi:tetratricopeptide (TPR) repeat protein
MKQTWAKAAEAMEQAAGISRKHDHVFSAAGLWLQADQPRKALPLLIGLADRPAPEARWLTRLSETWVLLEDTPRAAGAMERAAEITRKGKHYYRAGMLWIQAGDHTRGISLLRKSAATTPIKQEWLVSLAQALADTGQAANAASVLERTDLTDPREPSGVRFRGAALWLHLKRPQKAVPVLEVLCSSPRPEMEWVVSLVRASVELEQMGEAEKALTQLIDLYPQDPEAWRLAVWVGIQQADYGKAAAAMAVAVRLGPPDPGQLAALADLYHMAGVPVKAAAALRKTWSKGPSAADWDRLVDAYLSGHRYRMALDAARSAVKAEPTAGRWAKVGTIAFRLRGLEESLDAYRRSIALRPDAGLLIKAGYAALGLDRLNEAAALFTEAMRLAGKNSHSAHEAYRNLVYIKEMKAFLKRKDSFRAGE